MIAQLRTGFRQKIFRLKTCPQGVLQAHEEKEITTSLLGCVAENSPLKTINTLIFRCVPNDKCTGLLNVRGSDELAGLLNVRGSDDLVCEDSSQKCCHEYSVIENGKDENSNIGSSDIDYYDNKEYCSAYENEGYRFVMNCIHIISKYFHT